MKALDLLNELRSQITSKPDKGQEKVFYEKYANTKPDYFKEASAMLENYGHLAAPVIHEMTDCERDRLGNTVVTTVPFSSINARTYKADNKPIKRGSDERSAYDGRCRPICV